MRSSIRPATPPNVVMRAVKYVLDHPRPVRQVAKDYTIVMSSLGRYVNVEKERRNSDSVIECTAERIDRYSPINRKRKLCATLCRRRQFMSGLPRKKLENSLV